MITANPDIVEEDLSKDINFISQIKNSLISQLKKE